MIYRHMTGSGPGGKIRWYEYEEDSSGESRGVWKETDFDVLCSLKKENALGHMWRRFDVISVGQGLVRQVMCICDDGDPEPVVIYDRKEYSGDDDFERLKIVIEHEKVERMLECL